VPTPNQLGRRQRFWSHAKIQSAALGSLRRAADSLDHVDRSRGAEVAHEVARLVQEALICAAARAREVVHDRVPTRLGGIGRRRPRGHEQNGRHRLLETAHRDAAQAVLRVDRLALLGHPQAASDRAVRRGEHGFVQIPRVAA
jgi:hypothetical protein